jgi:colicin import membrane protein
MSNIPNDIKARIIETAEQLWEANGRERFPTVGAVRSAAKADMNFTSEVMKEWRKVQTATPVTVSVAVPESISKAGGELIVALWTQAQALANDSLRTAEAAWATERADAEQMRTELSASFEEQLAVVLELNQQLTAAQAAATETAESHQVEVKALQALHQGAEKSFHETRETLAETKGRLDGANDKLVTVEGSLTKAETALKASEQHGIELEQQLQSQRDKNAELLTQLEQATHRATLAETQVETERQALAKAHQATEAAQVKADQATAEVKAIDGKLRKLEVREGELVGENKALEKQLAALTKTLEKPNAEPKPKA